MKNAKWGKGWRGEGEWWFGSEAGFSLFRSEEFREKKLNREKRERREKRKEVKWGLGAALGHSPFTPGAGPGARSEAGIFVPDVWYFGAGGGGVFWHHSRRWIGWWKDSGSRPCAGCDQGGVDWTGQWRSVRAGGQVRGPGTTGTRPMGVDCEGLGSSGFCQNHMVKVEKFVVFWGAKDGGDVRGRGVQISLTLI